MVSATDAARPLRLAYADPPYPGLAGYYRGHPDYAGEVDHADLVSRLQKYDGWALSTSARALPFVLALCPPGARVAAWFKGARAGRARVAHSAWEPVIYRPGRPAAGLEAPPDALCHVARPRLTDPGRVIGAKPAAFCTWLFGLLGAGRGDALDDLFPGSGGVGRAWEVFQGEASCRARGDTSPGAEDDTSAPAPRDGSGPVVQDRRDG